MLGWISAGLTGLGMLSDRKQRRNDAYANSGVGVRADAEASGFNPLTLLGSGARASAGYGPTMGSSLAQAGQALTDWSSNEKMLELENARLQMDQQELQSRLEQQTLRPSVPGIYGNAGGTKNGVQNVQQAAEGGESGLPKGDEKGLVFGQSVESEEVFEIESDAYVAAIKGNIQEWAGELIHRNSSPEMSRFWSAYGAAFNPNSYIGAWRTATDMGKPLPASDPRHDVWRAQNYGPDYQPSSWRR